MAACRSSLRTASRGGAMASRRGARRKLCRGGGSRSAPRRSGRTFTSRTGGSTLPPATRLATTRASSSLRDRISRSAPKLQLTINARAVDEIDTVPAIHSYVDAGGRLAYQATDQLELYRRRAQPAARDPRSKITIPARGSLPSARVQGRGAHPLLMRRRPSPCRNPVAQPCARRSGVRCRAAERECGQGGLPAALRPLCDLAGVGARRAAMRRSRSASSAATRSAPRSTRRPRSQSIDGRADRRSGACLGRRRGGLPDRLRRRARTPQVGRILRGAGRPADPDRHRRPRRRPARHDPFHDRRRPGPLLHRRGRRPPQRGLSISSRLLALAVGVRQR